MSSLFGHEAEKIFPSNLRRLRVDSGLSQPELGEKVGKKQVTISTWERGTREPSLGDLSRLADVFGCTVDFLLGREGAEAPAAPRWVVEMLPDMARLDSKGREAVKGLVQALKR